MLRLISRMIGRHKLQMLQFYPNLLRYLNSHNKEKISEIFAMIIESCHEMVPPESVQPVIERIITNYTSEYSNNQHITVGLNAIREILLRMPLALGEEQIEYLCLFRTFKNKSVSSAAKSLVNFFRDVCPELLPKRMRGRFAEMDETTAKENLIFGQQRLNTDVEGIDLLKKAEKMEDGVNVGAMRILDDKDLKKIKILQLKEGVRRVDRHGFREDDHDGNAASAAQKTAVRDEYYHKMVELTKLRQQTKLMQEQGYELDEEMGEDEMDEYGYEAAEEGEMEMDEDESSDEECPELVPVGAEDPAKNSEISDIDVNDYGSSSSSEYDSDELDKFTTENPHGFMYANMLDTFQKGRKERIAEMADEKDHEAHRNKFKFNKHKNSKNIGKSQKVHNKNKPFMMTKKKKILELARKMGDTKPTQNRKKKTQLGHFRKAT